MNKGLNILPSFKYDEYMSDDEFRAIRHLHNVIAHRGDPNWVINYEQLKTHISEVIKNLLQQKDHKILQSNDTSYKSIVKLLLVNIEGSKLKNQIYDNFIKNPLPFYNRQAIQHQASSNAIAVDPAVKVQQFETHQTDEVEYNEDDEHQNQENASDNEGPLDPKPTPVHEETKQVWGEEQDSDDAQQQQENEKEQQEAEEDLAPAQEHTKQETNIPRESNYKESYYPKANRVYKRGGYRGGY